MSIENQMERIGNILEDICKTIHRSNREIPIKPVEVKIEEVKKAKEVMKNVEDKPSNGNGAVDRKEVIAKLEAIGATVNKRQRTEVLVKQLERENKRVSIKEEAKVETPKVEEIETIKTEIKSVSVKDAIDKLRVFSDVYGKSRALGLLSDFKVKKVSELNPSSLNQLVDKIVEEEMCS